MESLLSLLQNKKSWKSFLKTQCRRNSVDPGLANSFTLLKFRKFFDQKPNIIESPDKIRKKSLVWCENQLRAYQWFLIVMSGCKQILIKNFSNEQWEQLSKIFGKETSILKYEAIKLISEQQHTKRKWDLQESKFLQSIVKEDSENNKWNETARKLFEVSQGKYFRSGKQCREHWLNHLDPKKKHGQWLKAQDLKIIEFILKKGKRWAEIVRELNNQRTEHMIKNRYKTIMIKLKKTHEDVRNQSELLKIKIQQLKNQNDEKMVNEPQVVIFSKRAQLERPDFEGLPIIDSEEDEQNMNYDCNQRLKAGSVGQLQFQQVVTPCPNIYQIFTPTFLNTPHAVNSFLSNFSCARSDNLFLKNC